MPRRREGKRSAARLFLETTMHDLRHLLKGVHPDLIEAVVGVVEQAKQMRLATMSSRAQHYAAAVEGLDKALDALDRELPQHAIDCDMDGDCTCR